ncbi:MAG TPA: glycosyltransferase family 2 protein [Planctomycetota bacterium]|nr:glycosyltransferase family 2 protein [Planctomycetota bacterium]
MISVVIPCYNEQEVFPELIRRLTAAAASWGDSWEIILVNDGSRDNTWPLIVQQHAADPRFKGVNFTRNFGHQTAVSAGLHYTSGDCVVVMDADLQDPPEELGRFIAKWKEGFEVVYAIRTRRKEGIFKKIAYAAFYRLLQRIANIDIPLDSGDFCIMDRKVVLALASMPERARFVRGLRAWAGFKQVGLEYERQSRAAGAPKYTFWKLVKLATDGIFSFSTVPLRLATWLGLIVSVFAFLGIGVVIFQKLFPGTYSMFWQAPPPGYASAVAAMLFMGGVILVCLGIIGEYLGRIYEEVKQRPQWLIRERVGLDEPSSASPALPASAVPTAAAAASKSAAP